MAADQPNTAAATPPAAQDDDARSDLEQAVSARSDAVDRGEGNPEATEPDDFAGTGGTGGVVRNQDQDAQ
jgi:hypothetical protein